MTRSGWLPLAALAVLGCSRPAENAVAVNVTSLLPKVTPGFQNVRPLIPPQPVGTQRYDLPAKAAVRLVAQAGLDGEVLAREVDEAQSAALTRLRRRLSAVYAREADRFAKAQLRALGDPNLTAFNSLYPAFRKRFETYADQRAPLVTRLAFLVGVPDPNPKNDPPDPNLSPVALDRAKEAATLRTKIGSIDDTFDAYVRTLIDTVVQIGQDAKAATFLAIEANRDALNRQALAEATLPRSASGDEFHLELANAGVTRVPAVPTRGIEFAPTPAMPPLPKVEFPEASISDRQRLEAEIRVWAALQGYRLEKGGRDATTEFRSWKLSRAGASPNSPKS